MHDWTEFKVRGGTEKVSVFFSDTELAIGGSIYRNNEGDPMTAKEACESPDYSNYYDGPFATTSGNTIYATGCEEGDAVIILWEYEEDVDDEDFDGNDDGWKSLHSYEFQVVE